jgi:hypothetical protein
MDKAVVSYYGIKTVGLSTCLGVLFDGLVGNRKFCFLFHSSKLPEYNDDNFGDLLIYLVKMILKRLKET